MKNSLAGFDPIRLEVFKHLFASVADEMGVVLRRTSLSPNIKERRDFSCAIFNPQAQLVAQAAHIPVHLGSMPLSVSYAVDFFNKKKQDLKPGDVVILNDPYRGGTHLPDITMIAPVFFEGELLGYVGNRAHHADIGGMSPGSMTIARELYQEGLIIPPVKLVRSGTIEPAIMDLILANVRTPQERQGDLAAQMASIHRGALRYAELAARYGREEILLNAGDLLAYSDRMTRLLITTIPNGTYTFTDFLDDDGVSNTPVKITAAITISGDEASIDFTGSDKQVAGSMNAVRAITVSAVCYVFRCLLGPDIPTNAGCLWPIHVITPAGTVVDALHPAPVAGGNVETSQRLVDVLLGAFSMACPERIPAASQGTMNNMTLGGINPTTGAPFTYYETMAGGMGGRPSSPGPSAVHSHMTNTLNTPIEALEYSCPVQVVEYRIRNGSGGRGYHRGGDGLVRSIRMLTQTRVSLITDRRTIPPYGLAGGLPGQVGSNMVKHGDLTTQLPGKCTVELVPGEILTIMTPGGGGFGKPDNQD